MKLPESITKDLFVVIGIGRFNTGDINVRDFLVDVSLSGFEVALIKKISIDIDLPQDFDGVGAMVEQLQARKKKAEADHYVAIKKINDEISELLAITDKGEE